MERVSAWFVAQGREAATLQRGRWLRLRECPRPKGGVLNFVGWERCCLCMDLTLGKKKILPFDFVSKEPFGWTRGWKTTQSILSCIFSALLPSSLFLQHDISSWHSCWRWESRRTACRRECRTISAFLLFHCIFGCNTLFHSLEFVLSLL